MSKSSLATENYPAYTGNYSKGRTQKISKITIHHMAGKLTAKQCGQIFQTKGRKASSNYGIGYNGEIACYVDEADTSWCDANWNSNCKSVTIETSNSKAGGNWEVSDASLNSLIKLVADIAKRNNLGTLVKGKNLTWHSMYSNTACPGAYLLSKMDYIATEANKLLGGTNTSGSSQNSSNTSQNASNSIIKNIQTWYNNNYSYAFGKIDVDGSFGPDTKKHLIMALQQEMNLQYGSKLDRDGSFGPASKSQFLDLKRGVSGNITRICQAFLYKKGYNPNGFDSIYGYGCYNAVLQFQRNNGLKVDGILGKETSYKLFN